MRPGQGSTSVLRGRFIATRPHFILLLAMRVRNTPSQIKTARSQGSEPLLSDLLQL